MYDHEPRDPDHWEMFAEFMDLTIEGHRLIAQEIVHEIKLLWRTIGSRLRGAMGPRLRGAMGSRLRGAMGSRLRGLIAMATRRRSSPQV